MLLISKYIRRTLLVISTKVTIYILREEDAKSKDKKDAFLVFLAMLPFALDMNFS